MPLVIEPTTVVGGPEMTEAEAKKLEELRKLKEQKKKPKQKKKKVIEEELPKIQMDALPPLMMNRRG